MNGRELARENLKAYLRRGDLYRLPPLEDILPNYKSDTRARIEPVPNECYFEAHRASLVSEKRSDEPQEENPKVIPPKETESTMPALSLTLSRRKVYDE